MEKKAVQKNTEAWAHFKTLFGQGFLVNSALKRLFHLLLRLGSPKFEQEGFIWLEDLAHWMWQPGRVPKSVPTDNRSLARARLLHAVLKAEPALHEKLQRFMASVVKSMDVAHMLTDTGLPGQQAFGSEILNRFMLNVLPAPPVDQEFSSLLMRLFPSERAVGRFERLGAEGQTLLMHVFFGEEKALAQHWKDQMRRACRVLAMRISSNGLANDFDERVDKTRSGDKSPFLKLPSCIFAYVEEQTESNEKMEPTKSGKHPKMEDKEAQKTACREMIASCRRVVREVMDSLNHTGISVDLVYRLDLLGRRLDRLYALVSLCAPSSPEGMGLKLVGTLVRGCEKDRSLGELVRRNGRLLARRVIESAGHSGEHYITQTRKEQFQMLASAAGGGVLTAIAVAIKASLHLLQVLAQTPLFKGLAAGMNYAGVFVTMQLLGFTLATKQPSMTAATLAGALKEYTSSSEAEKRSLASLAELVVRTIRTQLFALLGNVGLVIPAALLINMGLKAWVGYPLMTMEEAEKSLHSFHLYESRSLAFAALTGGYLWLSSILAGTVENWVVFRKLPEAIASNRRFKKLLGQKRTHYLGQFVLKNASGLAGNISLGFMLGLTPAIGLFFGMDLDIRHITFAAGQLMFAVTSMGPDVMRTPEFLWALGGLAGIAVLNFGVSFSLALVVALRARDVDFSGDRRLIKQVFQHFFQRPLDFVFAPRMELATVPVAPGLSDTLKEVPANTPPTEQTQAKPPDNIEGT
ncbi:MAG: site-specific recombinase [Proteobacteria bacterium]|nr:site-specific recombinase [Cystobacterineae bacterium]MCL2258204.1 site-specific recombinase [Cystobacterineae bacterium]MCL2315452.1 site-specific recombinase [Pseudomonadota bacterium]